MSSFLPMVKVLLCRLRFRHRLVSVYKRWSKWLKANSFNLWNNVWLLQIVPLDFDCHLPTSTVIHHFSGDFDGPGRRHRRRRRGSGWWRRLVRSKNEDSHTKMISNQVRGILRKVAGRLLRFFEIKIFWVKSLKHFLFRLSWTYFSILWAPQKYLLL